MTNTTAKRPKIREGCPHYLSIYHHQRADRPWKVRHVRRLIHCLVNGPHDIHQNGAHLWR